MSQRNSETPLYGATDDEVIVKGKGQRVIGSGGGGNERVMNIYTNPAEHLDQMTALQRLQLAGNNDYEAETMMLVTSGGECNGKDLEAENTRNQNLEDLGQYLEPQVCMAHRPLPEVNNTQELKGKDQGHHQCQGHDDVTKAKKRKPQRFVRPKSPVKESHSTVPKTTDIVDHKQDPQNHYEDTEVVVEPENHYEDAEDVDENEYAEIPGDNIYETLDEMKRSLATMGEAQA